MATGTNPFGADGKVRSEADFIFYNQLKSACGSVQHTGDNLTGETIPPRNIPLRIATFDENPVSSEPDFEPNIFIYDNYPGGIGLSPALFGLEKQLLQHCLKTIAICPCQEGCPSCVGPARETGQQAKQVAQEILRGLLE